MRKLQRIISRIIAFSFAFMLMAFGMSFTSMARGLIDTSKSGTLTITYKYGDDKYFDGVEVNIYKIASVNADGTSFVLDEPYSEVSPVKDLSQITDENTAADQWAKILEAVEPYAVANSEVTAKTTSENGLAKFTNLDLGIYLVRSSTIVDEVEECTYVFKSFLISIPQLNENDEWIYDGAVYTATATAKCEKETLNEKFEILKRWNDSGYENLRPTSITVVISKDGEVFDTVTLSADNNWHYSWEAKAGSLWTFEETVSGNVEYSVSLTDSRANNNGVVTVTYILTNTYNVPETPPTPPDTPPDTPNTPDEPTTPDTPTTPGIPDLPEVLGAIRDLPAVLGARRLPQTGLLWWPLPILIIAGLLFIVKGIKTLRKNNA